MNWIPYVWMAGRAKDNLPGGSLKYLFVYLKVRVFKCSYRRFFPFSFARHADCCRKQLHSLNACNSFLRAKLRSFQSAQHLTWYSRMYTCWTVSYGEGASPVRRCSDSWWMFVKPWRTNCCYTFVISVPCKKTGWRFKQLKIVIVLLVQA